MNKGFFTKKKIIWGIISLVAVLAIVAVFRGRNKAAADIQTDAVRKQDLLQTVLTTGQVTSDVDLKLSFQSGGVVRQIMVKEGDKVKASQILAILDQSSARAGLLSAQGALAQANANYERVLEGATNEQIKVAERGVEANQQALDDAGKNLESVRKQQEISVANAYRTLLNTGLQALNVPGPFSTEVTSADTPVISGLFRGTEEGTYVITQSGNSFSVSGLEAVPLRLLDTKNIYTLGNNGLYVQFPNDKISATWHVKIPNDRALGYVLNFNAYQAALAGQTAALTAGQSQIDAAQKALQQAEANLEQLRATASSAEINAAKAQIISAQGQVVAAEAILNNTVIRAPSEGTVTQVDVKVGEQATPAVPVITVQDVGNVYAESNVSEANIASLKLGQTVDYTFDALGPDRHFKGKIRTINPASTLVSGVVNYKVTADFENVTEIKPGMTANMTVQVAERKGVLAVQSSAVLNRSGKKIVRVINNPEEKTFTETEVLTGLEADGGLVEIVSGLSENQEIVVFMK